MPKSKYVPTHLKLWEYPANYAGESYVDYYPIVGQSRDSDILEQSNWAVACDRMGPESAHVVIARAGHWAVGWVETLFVHKDAPVKLLKLANGIAESLEGYPVLDDSDYSEREHEYQSEYAESAQADLATALRRWLRLGRNVSQAALESVAYALNIETQQYAGNDACVNVYPFREPSPRDWDECRRTLKRVLDYSSALTPKATKAALLVLARLDSHSPTTQAKGAAS